MIFAGNNTPRSQRGLSYLEVLIATLVLTVSLGPLLSAMQVNNQTTRIDADLNEQRNHASSVLEKTLALPLATLLDEAVILGANDVLSDRYSDPASSAPRALVYLAAYDGDNADGDNNPFTGTDQNLLWVSVSIEGTSFELTALVSQ